MKIIKEKQYIYSHNDVKHVRIIFTDNTVRWATNVGTLYDKRTSSSFEEEYQGIFKSPSKTELEQFKEKIKDHLEEWYSSKITMGTFIEKIEKLVK